MINIDKKLLKQLYITEGKSTVEISKILNFSIDTIWKRLKLYKLNIRHPGSIGNETKIIKKNLYRMYVLEFKSFEAIGKIYNVSLTTIRNYMIRYGLIKYAKKYRPNFLIRGDNHPTKRPEVRKKMSKNHADFSGKNNPNYGATWMIGKNNPNWLGGKDKRNYSWKFNTILKLKIRKRDNYECKNCGMTEEEHFKKYNEKLHIHHIDYIKKNCNENNLITLCLKCNILANYNRKQWKIKFKGLLNE